MTPTGIVLFLVPGLLLAWQGERLRRALGDRGALLRIGVLLVQVSALGFALRGAFAPDPADPAALATRLHALGWSLWWIAFVPGGVLLAFGARSDRPFAFACLLAALLVPCLALAAPAWLGPGAASSLGIATWFAWWAFALWRVRPVAGSCALR